MKQELCSHPTQWQIKLESPSGKAYELVSIQPAMRYRISANTVLHPVKNYRNRFWGTCKSEL